MLIPQFYLKRANYACCANFPKVASKGEFSAAHSCAPVFSFFFFFMTWRYFKQNRLWISHLLLDGWQRINKRWGGGPRGIRMLWLNDQRVTSAKALFSMSGHERATRPWGESEDMFHSGEPECDGLRIHMHTLIEERQGMEPVSVHRTVYPRGWGCSFHSFSLASVRQAFPWYVLPCSACLCTHSENSFQIRPRDLAQE